MSRVKTCWTPLSFLPLIVVFQSREMVIISLFSFLDNSYISNDRQQHYPQAITQRMRYSLSTKTRDFMCALQSGHCNLIHGQS